MTLRWRLTLLYTALTSLLVAVVAATVYGSLAGFLYNNVDRDLVENQDLVSKLLGASQTGVIDLRSLPASVFAQVDTVSTALDATGELVVTTFPWQGGTPNLVDPSSGAFYPIPWTAAELARVATRGELLVRRKEVQIGDRTTAMSLMGRYYPDLRVMLNGQLTTFQVLVSVGRDLTTVEATLRGLQGILLVVSLGGIIAASLGSFVLAGQALRPIRAVSEAAAGITDRKLSQRVPEPATHDEVDALAKSLNAMLDRLESAFEAQRRFTADASHELRTPVTAITGHANFLLRRTSPNEAQRESLEIIRSEGGRLSRLVGDLLDLARADAGLKLELADVNLTRVAEEVHLEIVPIAGDTAISVEGPSKVLVKADGHRVHQVVLNLVQNAVKAGAAEVRVAVSSDGKVGRIIVEDDGPGIAQEHLPHLFDRFYRVDTARNREQGGSGLGLSIVRRLVDAHGGNVAVTSKVGEGTRFEVTLPVAGPGERTLA